MTTLKELSTGRENSITFLRLIAALAVIYGHAYAIVPAGGHDWVTKITGYAHAGGVAVDFFFLLSGFLVTASVIKRGVFSYLTSRALRLFPALWAYVVIMTLIAGPLLTTLPLGEYLQHPQTWNYLVHLGAGWTTEWFLPGVFESNRSHGVNGSIWSVIVEIRMYLYLALFYVLGGFKSRLRFNILVGVLVTLVWSDVIAIPGIVGSTDKHVALFFVIGCFLHVNRDLIAISPMTILGAFALAAITHGTDKFQYAYTFLLTALFCVTAFLKEGHWVDRYGDYSYGVYLWGWPVQQVVTLVAPDASAIANALVSMVLSLLLAIASWHLVEQRVLDLKPKVDAMLQRLLKAIPALPRKDAT
jgi:peptidoglycan/LPS O-acetylase OafA/YrhL